MKSGGKMPKGDRTGPEGQGPMTGRGLGFCSGNNKLGFEELSFRNRRNSGRGFGFQRIRNSFRNIETNKQEEREILERNLENLKQETKEIEEKLKEFH